MKKIILLLIVLIPVLSSSAQEYTVYKKKIYRSDTLVKQVSVNNEKLTVNIPAGTLSIENDGLYILNQRMNNGNHNIMIYSAYSPAKILVEITIKEGNINIADADGINSISYYVSNNSLKPDHYKIMRVEKEKF